MASYVNDRVDNLHMIWRDSCASGLEYFQENDCTTKAETAGFVARVPHHVHRGF